MQGTDLAVNSLDEVECTAHHPGCVGLAGIMSVIMTLLSVIDLVVAAFHQSWSLLVKTGCLEGESGALN